MILIEVHVSSVIKAVSSRNVVTALVLLASQNLCRPIQYLARLYVTITAIDFFNRQCLSRESGVWTVCQNSHVLFKLLYFGLENVDLCPLRFGVFQRLFQSFVQYFILISLRLDCCLERLIIVSELLVELILHNLSFFDEDIHHDIDLLPNLVGLFFE